MEFLVPSLYFLLRLSSEHRGEEGTKILRRSALKAPPPLIISIS